MEPIKEESNQEEDEEQAGDDEGAAADQVRNDDLYGSESNH